MLTLQVPPFWQGLIGRHSLISGVGVGVEKTARLGVSRLEVLEVVVENTARFEALEIAVEKTA